ncbi:proline-specific peptidase [Heliocybe sulcata]|uniref:Proline-specific peptidase n=1 Tax=Heliocybe sulcata TaxID=5364 RepID=A0A5C3NCD8_9AGAM|nr:proline-specific peptidase [Heliocybe sulcata]
MRLSRIYSVLWRTTALSPFTRNLPVVSRLALTILPAAFLPGRSCASSNIDMPGTASPAVEGFAPFSHSGESFQTYYKVFGDLKTRTRAPLIALHGGPGLVHDYLVPFADLTSKNDIPVILYDQLGNGRSTHLKDKPPTFWTVDLFIDELVNLINHLGVHDGFNLVGHSWGGILASEFEVRRQPEGLKHMILTDSLAASSLWNKANGELWQAFPDDVKAGMAAGMSDPKAFHAALLHFHATHGCTVRPFPKEYTDTLDQVFGEKGDPTVAMSPVLKDWTIIDRLHLVRVPTFVINGANDISKDYVVAPFFEKIQKVKWVTFQKSTHSPFWEEREKYMQLVGDFLAL